MRVQIFRDGCLIETRLFERQFMLVLRHEHLRWECDEETARPEGGILQTWIHRSWTGSYTVSFILPTWRVTINGVEQAQNFYTDLPLNGDRIEFLYANYRFCIE